MTERSRASRFARHFDPNVLSGWHDCRRAWFESPDEVAHGLRWGRRKAILLAWVEREIPRRLSLREAACIHHYYFLGQDYRSIAMLLGVHASTVCRTTHRAVEKLRRAAEADPNWRRALKRLAREQRRAREDAEE